MKLQERIQTHLPLISCLGLKVYMFVTCTIQLQSPVFSQKTETRIYININYTTYWHKILMNINWSLATSHSPFLACFGRTREFNVEPAIEISHGEAQRAPSISVHWNTIIRERTYHAISPPLYILNLVPVCFDTRKLMLDLK